MIEDKVYTVSQLNKKVKNYLDENYELREFFLEGELSGVTYYKSGHLYFNIKDKDEDIINSQHAREDGHKPLDELESLLLDDTAWQDKIIEVLAKRENWIIDRSRLHGHIRDFFDEQRIGGNAQRDESDCRSHFYHWIIKHLNTTRYKTEIPNL